MWEGQTFVNKGGRTYQATFCWSLLEENKRQQEKKHLFFLRELEKTEFLFVPNKKPEKWSTAAVAHNCGGLPMSVGRGFDTAHARLDLPGGERYDARFTPMSSPRCFQPGVSVGANLGMIPVEGRESGRVCGPGVDGAASGAACTVNDVDVTPSSLFVAGGVNRSGVLEEGSAAYVAMGRRWPEYLSSLTDGEEDRMRERLARGVVVADDLSQAFLSEVRPESLPDRLERQHRSLGKLRNSPQFTDRPCMRGAAGDGECSCFVCFAVGAVMEMVHNGAALCV
jgi:hypothetical protein